MFRMPQTVLTQSSSQINIDGDVINQDQVQSLLLEMSLHKASGGRRKACALSFYSK